jgi:hypothetical protein
LMRALHRALSGYWWLMRSRRGITCCTHATMAQQEGSPNLAPVSRLLQAVHVACADAGGHCICQQARTDRAATSPLLPVGC